MAIYDIHGNTISTDAVFPDLLRYDAFLHQLLAESGSGTMQGACTDGEYIYYLYYTSNTIKKYNISTGEVTSVYYASGLYGHGNDMTYNPNTDRIYITVMDDAAHIAVVNPSTLEQVEQFVLYGEGGAVQPCHGIAYDRINNRYVVANATTISGTYGQRYSLYDSSFNFVRTIVMPAPESWTIQGIETDGVYIYRALRDSTNNTNYVKVYDYDGNYIKTISVKNSAELETIMNDWNGNWYCNFNTSAGGSLYICGLPKEPFESIEKLM